MVETVRNKTTQAGFSLLYIIAAMTIMGALSAGVYSFTTSASLTEVSSNYRDQAELMAEAGLNYAQSRYYEDEYTFTDIDGKTYTFGADQFVVNIVDNTSAGTWDITSIGQAGSGYWEARKRAELRLSKGGGGMPVISFEDGEGGSQDMPHFTPVGTFTNDYATSGDTVTVDTSTNTIALGNFLYKGAGCIWYQGTRGPCNFGNCTFGHGVRAYFEFEFLNNSNADGFVFTIANANFNGLAACGGDPEMGELMGYGGRGRSGNGIRPPKFALEFDTWNNPGSSLPPCSPNTRWDYTPFYDHLAWLYWGEEPATYTGCNKVYPASYDDNRHGSGNGTIYQPQNKRNPDGTGGGLDGYYYLSIPDWLQDGGLFSIRFEIDRHLVPTKADTYCYELRAWLVKRNELPLYPGFDDVRNDYFGRQPDVYDQVTLDENLHQLMDNIQFGWTQATGAATQLAEITKFQLTFKKAPRTPMPPDGYTSWWTFNEGTGTTVFDSGPGDNTGQFNGPQRQYITWDVGRYCAGLHFGRPPSGSIRRNVRVPDDSSLDLSSEGTIAAWIKLDEYRNWAAVVAKNGNTYPSTGAYFLSFTKHNFKPTGQTGRISRGDRRIQLLFVNSLTKMSAISTTQDMLLNRWYHVAGTWDSDRMDLYIDGQLNATRSGDINLPRINNQPLNIGSFRANSRRPFVGSIDEVYIYPAKLDAAEIAGLASNCTICRQP